MKFSKKQTEDLEMVETLPKAIQETVNDISKKYNCSTAQAKKLLAYSITRACVTEEIMDNIEWFMNYELDSTS